MKRIYILAPVALFTLVSTAGMAQVYFPEGGEVPTQPNLSEIPSDDIVIVPQPPAASAEAEARSVSSGNWNQPWVWDCSCIPGADHDVIISSGHQINLTANAQAVNLTIEADGVFAGSESSNVQLNIHGDWNNEGSFNRGMSLINFVGELNQQINGESDFFEISAGNQATVTVNSAIGVFGRLYVNSGSLVTNDLLTLKASGTTTVGSIAPMLDGTIDGNIGFERNVVAPYNGWLTIGAPIGDATIAEINDDFVTTGFEGSDYPGYSFVSIRTYNEAAETPSAAFAPVASTSDPMTSGLGYYVYANAGSYTYTVNGTPVSGDFSFPVSYTDQGTPVQDGLNVVANPYPSEINWDHEGAWVKENMYSAIYVWDVSINQFRTYVNGFGVNGGTPFIKAGEAFWVQASGANPELSVNETAKVYNAEANVNETGNFLKLRIDGLGLGDETIIAFDEGASSDFDMGMDAFKFFSDNAILNLATRSSDDIFLAINNHDLTQEAFSVPIILTSSQSGPVTLSLLEKPVVEDRCLYIEDTVTGMLYPLEETNTIEFLADVVTQQIRFLLHVTQAITANGIDVACEGTETGAIEVEGFGPGPWDYYFMDEEGNVIGTELGIAGPGQLTELASGNYSVNVVGIEQCGSLSATVAIADAEPMLLEATAQGLDCDESDTGAIFLTVEGGAGDYSFLWNDGSTEQDRSGLAGGSYTVTVTDANDCESTLEVAVDAAPSVNALFEADAQVVVLSEGSATVNFTNMTENADSFVWDFGDGSSSSEEANPSHVYTQPGNYIVLLEATNGSCSGSYQIVVIVEEGTGVNDRKMEDSVEIYTANGVVFIRFLHEDYRNYRLEAYNMLGQSLVVPLEGQYGQQRIQMQLDRAVPAALISVVNTDTGARFTQRILR